MKRLQLLPCAATQPRMRAGPFLLYVIGIAFFCAMDAVMKLLVLEYPALMATFWRYVMAVFFTLFFWARAGWPPITREMLPVHALRGAVIAGTAFLFFWSFTVLPLAQAVTIAFVAPLMVPPLGSLILGEKMQSGSVAAGVAGFLGVVVAVGFDAASWTGAELKGVLAVLLSAALYALSVVLMRKRASKDGAAIVSLLGAAIPMAVIFPFLIALVPAEDMLPRGEGWIWVLLAGLFGAIALQFYARAYAQAEAQLLAPFEYTALLWAAIFGWFFFAEEVSPRTWLGALIIAGACLWQARRGTAQSAAA